MITFYIRGGSIASPTLHTINMADSRTWHKKHLTVTHPDLVTELEIFTTPNVKPLVVETKLEKELSRNGKQTAGHSRRAIW